MNYRDWVTTVPVESSNDSLWRMEGYPLALSGSDVAWQDVTTKLAADLRVRSLADQLYRAVGSLAANLSEGYSRITHHASRFTFHVLYP